MSITSIIEYFGTLRGKRVALTGHLRPDGDALGSCVGLASVFRANGIFSQVIVAEPIPAYIDFLAADKELVVPVKGDAWIRDYDCLGVLDCGEVGRLPECIRPALDVLPAFNIDHHASSDGVGEAQWVWPEASSTGEMICDIFRMSGWDLTSQAADALWTALATDTGRFCYENTSLSCMEAAVWCLRGGAKPGEISGKLFQSVTWEERQLQRVVLDKMELHWDGQVAFACLERDDFLKAGTGGEGAQNLVSLLRDTVGVRIAAFLYEPPTASDPERPIKVSMRSSTPYDILPLVTQFGGGGHQRAAGCSLPPGMPAARQVILDSISELWFSGETVD